MLKLSKTLLAVLCTVFLLVGGIIGTGVSYSLMPEKVTINTEIKEVEIPVEKIVEVKTEVPSESILDKAVATFMEAVENEEDEAGNIIDLQRNYDFNQISISKISKNYNVSYTKDTQIVNFGITLKYDEIGDNLRSEKITYDVIVTYTDGEDTIVEIN